VNNDLHPTFSSMILRDIHETLRQTRLPGRELKNLRMDPPATIDKGVRGVKTLSIKTRTYLAPAANYSELPGQIKGCRCENLSWQHLINL
jgi:hypothetical protein